MKSSCDFKAPPGVHINSRLQPHSEEAEVWSGLKAACTSVPSTLLIASGKIQTELSGSHTYHCLQPHARPSVPLSQPRPSTKSQPSGTNDKSMTTAEKSLSSPNASLVHIPRIYYLRTNGQLLRPVPPLRQDGEQKVKRASGGRT